ncbi:MAG: glutamate--tRNA ligase [Nanoarchaeota archaeon]
MNLEKFIWAYALQNAIDFGKTDASKILPKLFQHGLDRKDIGKIMPEIQKVVAEVNKLSSDKKVIDFKNYEKFVKVHEHKDGGLPELEHTGKVVTRLPPEPSKYNHIGHALIFIIQYLYAKKYNGKCILRIEDTNPEKSSKEFYDAMKEDLSWLGIKWDEEVIASNDLVKMYGLCEKLLNNGDAFVCSCSQDKIKELREQMIACSCRSRDSKVNLAEWKMMLDKKFKDGERIVRLKGDMGSNNGVMRDPVIFRISYASHFLQKKKYCVWPTYDFENPVEDSLNGVSHVIRTNEFELRDELHKFIQAKLGLKSPIVREIGRYRIAGAETQGRVIREMIESGKMIGWDDPRLVTIRALRRRGFLPEMFFELAKVVGLSKSSGQIDFAVLESINRKLVDASAKRYFFIQNPIKISVDGAPSLKCKAPLHPSGNLGFRALNTNEDFYITKKDFDSLNKSKKGNVRFMHLLNASFSKGKFAFLSEEVDSKLKASFVHWLPASKEESIKTRIMMSNAEFIEGFLEAGASKLKIGEIVQFERFGFVRLDKKSHKGMEFWFTCS